MSIASGMKLFCIVFVCFVGAYYQRRGDRLSCRSSEANDYGIIFYDDRQWEEISLDLGCCFSLLVCSSCFSWHFGIFCLVPLLSYFRFLVSSSVLLLVVLVRASSQG